MSLNSLFFLLSIASFNFYAFTQETKENEIDSSSVNNIYNLDTINSDRIDNTIKFSFRAGINNETEFDSIYNLILANSDSINQIHINGFDKINYLSKDSLHKIINKSIKDSILKNLSYKIYDSIKVILRNSVGKLLIFKSEKIVKTDSLE